MTVVISEVRDLRRAFGAFPTGVVAVAALGPRGPIGIAASSFTSVSLAPPIVSVNIARASKTLPALRERSHWGVSVLAEGQEVLGRQLSLEPDQRFAGVDWQVTESGAVLLRGAAATFTVRVDSFVSAGDHEIALLHVEDVQLNAGTSPLVFHASRFRQLGIASRAD
ncbi:flavin reductase family protein [Smaragdicoccus niigatensis]|uniref:flavin reductase family protein n=1 Tax=Smaragdicoccus niigatensis TaxID=359359 RepID=UPI0003757678|nr:flavin reductase family protein [Smaragdicoccus niigatensis]